MGVFQVIFRGLLFNRIRNAVGDVKTSLFGLGSYILSFGSLMFVSKFWHLSIVLIFISFSGAMSRGIILGFASQTVDHRNQGKINGLTSSMDSFSQIFGPILGSVMISLGTPIYFSILLMGIAVFPFLMGFLNFKYGFDSDETEENKINISETIDPESEPISSKISIKSN
jgi:MFS family permease